LECLLLTSLKSAKKIPAKAIRMFQCCLRSFQKKKNTSLNIFSIFGHQIL
jgi:hypothetical protein